jgi:serine/threonine protein phosphatase 1
MMNLIYAVSDLHGCYDKYIKLLERLNMTPNDSLYVLGDIVDRGSDGMKILSDLIKRKNIFSCRGNHDHCAQILLRSFAMPNDGCFADGLEEAFGLWLSDGGSTTYDEFLKLDESNRHAVLNYLNSLPLFEKLTVEGRRFFLAHTVPEKSRMLDFDKCRISDFIMGEPEYEKVYFEDKIIVTGHTPTGFIDPEYTGRIWKGNNHIAIDCGAVFGNPLGCICLDTMEEIYVE